MKMKLMFFVSMTVICLSGMQGINDSTDEIDQKKIIECHNQNFPLFLKSIQTTRRVIFNFADFADAEDDMITRTKIGIANGYKEIRKYLDGENKKILLFSQGKPQVYLNLSNINENKLQRIEDYMNIWTIINDQEEIDASAIIYNISKDCIVPMSDHVSTIKELNRKNSDKSKHFLINIDNRIKDKSDIDTLLNEIPLANVVVYKPVELIAAQEENEIAYTGRFGMPVAIKKNKDDAKPSDDMTNQNVKHGDSTITKNDDTVDTVRFRHIYALFNTILTYKKESFLIILGLFLSCYSIMQNYMHIFV